MAISTIGTNALADGTIAAADIQDGAVTTAKHADASITPAKMANSGYELGMRNRIINGDFRIWQRGTSGTSVGTTVYGPDRWRVYGGNALTLTSSTSFGSPQSLLIQANGTNHGIGQRIEAANIADLAGQTVTISYKIRADFPATHNLLMYYGGTKDDFSAEVNFLNVAKSYTSNTVTTITHTVTLPSQAANGVSLVFQWYNAGASINITAFIWDIQLEAGSTATPFDRRPIGTELALCQRYFEKSFNWDFAPSNGSAGGFSTSEGMFGGYISNTYPWGGYLPFKATKRTTPTMGAYGNSSGYWYAGGGFGSNAAAFSGVGSNGVLLSQQQVGGSTVTAGHWTASAEL